MKKSLLAILILLVSGCCITKYFRNDIHECSISQVICEHNINELEDRIKTFKADGGAYIVKDLNTNEIVEKAAINFDYNEIYKPYFSKIKLYEFLSPLQLVDRYASLMKDNTELNKILRDNVQYGTAKRANVKNVDVYGATATTQSNSRDVITAFLGHFEGDGKRYALIVVLNNPQPLKSTYGFRTAGWNAVPLGRDLIKSYMSK